MMMNRKDFETLKSLCRSYDPFTQYIDSYEQELQAEENNRKVNKRFNEILKSYTGEDKDYYMPCTNCTGEILENDLTEWLNELGIEVEPRKVWTEQEIATLIQTNDKVFHNIIKKIASLFTPNYIRDYFSKADYKFFSSIYSYYLKNNHYTAKQVWVARKKLANYTSKLTELANMIE